MDSNKNFILGTKIYTAIITELMEANNTAPAEVSFEILAKLLNSFFTTKSTIDSIDVFSISNIKTDVIVAIKIKKLL